MKRINSRSLLKKYIKKYRISEMFSNDLEEYMELIAFEKGEYLSRDGEYIEHLLFLVKGKAKVYINLENGKALLLCFYYPFMLFGDLELVSQKPASTNTVVIDEVHCIALPLNKVREELLKDSRLMGCVCASLGDKLERASKNGTINLLYPLENRVASYIIATMEKVQAEDKLFQFNENLTTFAELLGTSYRHLLRTLNKLVDQGLLQKIKGGYMIIDEETLRRLAADIYM